MNEFISRGAARCTGSTIGCAAAAAALLLLAGCVGGKPAPEPKRLLLSYDGPVAEVPATAATKPRPRLVVRSVDVPEYLDRREQLRRGAGSTVVVDRTAVWAERPGKAITRWVSLALAAQRPDWAVESVTTADGRAPEALVAITLDGFEPDADGAVRLRGHWSYVPYGRVVALSGRFDADATPADASAEANVAALKSALGKAVERLARDLPRGVVGANAAVAAPK